MRSIPPGNLQLFIQSLMEASEILSSHSSIVNLHRPGLIAGQTHDVSLNGGRSLSDDPKQGLLE